MSKSVDDVDALTTMFADIDPTLFDEICPSDDKARSARVKFTDFQDYLRTMGRGAQRLEEETMKEEKAPIDSCNIKLLRLGDNNNNEYNAIFRTPAGYRGKLEPGDRAVAYLKIEETQDSNIEETKGGPWDMRMIEPPAYARRGEITAVLARRWNEDHDKWFDERELPTITPPSDRKGGAELGYILKQRGIEARIEPVDRHSLWVYIKKAYFQLHTLSLSTRLSPVEQSVLDFLVGDFTSLKAFNIYDTLMNKSLASETCMELNDSQKEAIHMGTKAPGGFVVCHGGPGTGKTHFVMQAITPFLKDSACDHHLLLTAATNRGVDSMACELHERLKNLSNHDALLKNRYILRLSMSLQERAQLAEFPSAFFTLQYRAVPQIAALYNRACYLNQLVDHETTFLDNGKRLLARQVVAHNNDKYGISASVIFYETKVAKEMQAYQKSKVCEQYATLAMKILENLLVAGFGGVEKPCTIAILTPYRGQYNVLCVAKEKMAKRYPEAEKVLVEMVGKSQGIEYDIVIADPVIASARRCFLTKNRLNVLFSRARQGLYVVGSYAKWSAMEKEHAPHLQAFIEELHQYRITWTPGNALRSEFIDHLDFVSSYDSD
ncbi:hypothetical protein LTR40_007537 [Exophiala xenobiotica]|nr:hypothetical protein LTR40_007537 [Exophiala xenobiotica]